MPYVEDPQDQVHEEHLIQFQNQLVPQPQLLGLVEQLLGIEELGITAVGLGNLHAGLDVGWRVRVALILTTDETAGAITPFVFRGLFRLGLGNT